MTHNWRVVSLRAFGLRGEAEIHETLPVAFLAHRSTTAFGVANRVLDVLGRVLINAELWPNVRSRGKPDTPG
jgi:hypothetical protein